MSDEVKAIYMPFENCKWLDTRLITLANEIKTAIPQVQFKQGDVNTYNIPDECKPDGVTQSLDIFFDDEPNNRIGVIGFDKWNDKLWITNRNIPDGRDQYGRGEGQTKQSKHLKNVVNVGFPFDHNVADIASELTTKSSGAKGLNAMFMYFYFYNIFRIILLQLLG